MNGLFQLLRKKKVGCWIVLGMFCGLLGYADDTIALCPSCEGLQDMMTTCEQYAASHNLQFSTNIDPKKSKTKCLAFLKKERELKKIVLDGNDLPWWDSGKHIGNHIKNALNGMQKDIRAKRATYIQKNCEINQEFHFAHPSTRNHINRMYNFSFTGSSLWDLFGDSSTSLEKTYNVSTREMYKLPRQTHRYLIEPVTKEQHLKLTLIKRFLQFKEQVMRCPKTIVKTLFTILQYDTRSLTGSNFRKIMLMCDKDSIENVNIYDIDMLNYANCPENEKWRLSLVDELIEIRTNPSELLPGFTLEEIEDMLCHVCVS